MKVNPITNIQAINVFKKHEDERRKASKNFADYLHFVGEDDEESNVSEGNSYPLNFNERCLTPVGDDFTTGQRVYDEIGKEQSDDYGFEIPDDIEHIDLEA